MDEALELPADEQKTFVENACEGDADLLASVIELLNADEQSKGFLESSVGEHAAKLIESTQDSDAQSITIGAFKTTRLLGYGGMGVVYLAHRADGEFEQQVAIKCMRGIIRSAEMQQQFLAER